MARIIGDKEREALEAARKLMTEALELLDAHSRSTAAASLDLALQRLLEELEG